MKKKLVTLAMAAVMTFAMSLTAFAAGSSTATSVPAVRESAAAVTAVTATAPASETAGVTADVGDLPAAVTAAETNAVLAQGAASKNCTVVKTTVIEIGGTLPADGKVRITVTGLGVNVGDGVMIQHFVNGAYKEESGLVVGPDTIEITGLTSLSPFVISVLASNPAPAPAAAAASTATTGTATSPKTGFSLEVIFAAIADLF